MNGLVFKQEVEKAMQKTASRKMVLAQEEPITMGERVRRYKQKRIVRVYPQGRPTKVRT